MTPNIPLILHAILEESDLPWDGDRLDLGRVGITPHPSRLCTEVVRRPETIRWADGRATFRVIPEFVREEWGIDLVQRR